MKNSFLIKHGFLIVALLCSLLGIIISTLPIFIINYNKPTPPTIMSMPEITFLPVPILSLIPTSFVFFIIISTIFIKYLQKITPNKSPNGSISIWLVTCIKSFFTVLIGIFLILTVIMVMVIFGSSPGKSDPVTFYTISVLILFFIFQDISKRFLTAFEKMFAELNSKKMPLVTAMIATLLAVLVFLTMRFKIDTLPLLIEILSSIWMLTFSLLLNRAKNKVLVTSNNQYGKTNI
ncbi:MAG: hypothetical protein A2653_01345 [Candidatus Zambryskibacteria bacterium RIFCSPHIGHO2_01_FULL_43_25]|uniref:Uncharacterized protein n=1 Tax=Candidatus Zambryskibacteria bacterium RIFCSPLOWO2_01_FULL_45_21 TaxID=1802761 RepID=A0A1G2U3Y2_9BACT|nr:MAG: hypothetical protein A2653_01345 [Candidatus Zambryskibacteria bacterium RIFCSPHIGHO2_01_FULL_43_25]OHB00399.1 MAG: hypothetical protein A3E94_01695 [Candidatus Zambryskibacteria bacterium RIFCSPHIGHO2_12_FULL_44_12b]OHB04194.1 MAG: hypothetical protein A3B14_02170 [Candidatus Zambryskibacteria bacterium RIFCSPLOWO2_01_FULL_45_21]